MYEKLYQSPNRPFRATPDANFYFPHPSIETARQTAKRAIERAEGPVMVLGGAGLGKSLLAEVLSQDLAPSFQIVRLHAARLCSRRALLQSILFELNLPFRDMNEGELRLSIMSQLEPASGEPGEGILIIVDEAHTLPVKLLEELRLLTNFARNGQPRVRLVLIGSMQLEDTFSGPQLESFNQRLAARCYLTPMNRQETLDYVSHQISVAGFPVGEFITSDGLQAIYAASEGVPRLANQVMDHALVLAATNNQSPVSAALVEEAWADLQQLPAPWHSPTTQPGNAEASTIEFAPLEDELDEAKAEVDATSEPLVADFVNEATELEFESEGSIGESESVVASPPIAADGIQTDGTEVSFFDSMADWEAAQATERGEVSDCCCSGAEPNSAQPDSAKADCETCGSGACGVCGTDSALSQAVSDEIFITPTPAGAVTDHLVFDSVQDVDTLNPDALADVNEIPVDDSLPQNNEAGFFSAFSAGAEDDLGISQELELPQHSPQKPQEQVAASEVGDVVQDQSGDISSEAVIAESGEEGREENSGENLGPQASEEVSQVEIANALVESYFDGRQTDDQLIALADEQQQFDAMGIWENDPPLSRISDLQNETVNQADSIGDELNANPSEVNDVEPPSVETDAYSPGETWQDESAASEGLFGGGFDEELEVTAAWDDGISSQFELAPSDEQSEQVAAEQELASGKGEEATPLTGEDLESADGLRGNVEPEVTSNRLQTEDEQSLGQEDRAEGETEEGDVLDAAGSPALISALAADHERQIREYAEYMSQLQNSGQSVDEVLEPLAMQEAIAIAGQEEQLVDSASFEAASIDAASIDVSKEEAVHSQIEDIVSQLNFSAFAVEPFSVEQITLQQPGAAEVPNDAIRNGADDEVYMMHRAELAANQIASEGSGVDGADDDRDLLIIEDEVLGAESRSVNTQESVERAVPYTQLFSKLRK